MRFFPSGSPAACMSPRHVGTSPLSARRMVDLPEPDSPTRPNDSPVPTASEASRTASTRSSPSPNQTSRFRMSMLTVRADDDRPVTPDPPSDAPSFSSQAGSRSSTSSRSRGASSVGSEFNSPRV